jgi:hypothetical protein
MRTPGSVEIVAEVLSTTRNNGFVDHVCRMSDVSRPFLSDLLSLGLSSLQPGTLDAAIADEGRAWTTSGVPAPPALLLPSPRTPRPRRWGRVHDGRYSAVVRAEPDVEHPSRPTRWSGSAHVKESPPCHGWRRESFEGVSGLTLRRVPKRWALREEKWPRGRPWPARHHCSSRRSRGRCARRPRLAGPRRARRPTPCRSAPASERPPRQLRSSCHIRPTRRSPIRAASVSWSARCRCGLVIGTTRRGRPAGDRETLRVFLTFLVSTT